MKKRFNVTGPCNPRKHYMVNINKKIGIIEEMIDRGDYFVINRPRQYGKTTTIYALERRLNEKYIIINCSFEGIGDIIFGDEEKFSYEILDIFANSIENTNNEAAQTLTKLKENVNNLKDLSRAITAFVKGLNKEVILIIDEVDKSSNNQLFSSFLGMLRNKFIQREQDKDYTFHSVILAGVHDVKNLKLKIRTDEEIKLNSPWNIAVNFNVDMSFSTEEIETMLIEYSDYNSLVMNTIRLAEKLNYYSSGYPFLVSRLCQIIDENILGQNKRAWNLDDIDKAVNLILKENNTLFDDLIKNLENNNEIYNLVEKLILSGDEIPFSLSEIIISLSKTYGIVKENNGMCKLNNKIFELYIYNHMTAKIIRKNETIKRYNYKNNFITSDNKLDFEKVLLRYQQFMKEQYSSVDANFIEREGRLLFLAFIKPIINGTGFDFKEVQISEEKRLDVVVTYNSNKYVIELKIWHGQEYHKKGIKQLVDYLDIQGLDKGYLVVYNFNKNKEYKQEQINCDQKEIFMVYV